MIGSIWPAARAALLATCALASGCDAPEPGDELDDTQSEPRLVFADGTLVVTVRSAYTGEPITNSGKLYYWAQPADGHPLGENYVFTDSAGQATLQLPGWAGYDLSAVPYGPWRFSATVSAAVWPGTTLYTDIYVEHRINWSARVRNYCDSNGWDDGPEYYETIDYPDVDGDGYGDVCGRGYGGIWCSVGGWSFTLDQPTLWAPEFSDPNGWADGPEYYSTLRYPDVTGDGKADVCGRGGFGIWCARSNGDDFEPATLWASEYSDGNGWNGGPQYYGTIEYPDVNGDGAADVCGRGGGGVWCALSNGSSFDAATLWTPQYSDQNAWDAGAEYHSTIAFPDLDGDGMADICGRASAGLRCALSDGTAFVGSSLWTTNFSDAQGWGGHAKYYSTIQYSDIDGDGMADVCGRGRPGVWCSKSDGSRFGTLTLWSEETSDANGGGFPHKYETLEIVDYDGDGRSDLCRREALGVLCNLSDGTRFDELLVVAAKISDENEWYLPQYFRTLGFTNLIGSSRKQLCGRDKFGIYCTNPSCNLSSPTMNCSYGGLQCE